MAKKIPLTLLIALVGFPQISETIYTPSLPAVAEGLKTSASLVEQTLGVYFFGFACGVFLWGQISDYLGRRTSMLIGLLFYLVASYGGSLSSSVEQLIVWRFFQAFGASVGSVITQTILREVYTGEERSKIFSILSGTLAFSPAIGPFLGGFISENLNWKANFWLLTLLGATLFVWSYKKLAETKPAYIQNSNPLTIFKSLLGNKTAMKHMFLIGLCNAIIFGFYQDGPFLFINELGMNPSHYGLFGLIISASTILSAKISYKGIKNPSLKGSIWTIGGALLFILFAQTELNAIYSAIPLFLIFLGIGLILPDSFTSALKDFKSCQGTAGSLFGTLYYLLISACLWILSEVHNGTTTTLPLFILALSLTLLCLSQLKTQRAPQLL